MCAMLRKDSGKKESNDCQQEEQLQNRNTHSNIDSFQIDANNRQHRNNQLIDTNSSDCFSDQNQSRNLNQVATAVASTNTTTMISQAKSELNNSTTVNVNSASSGSSQTTVTTPYLPLQNLMNQQYQATSPLVSSPRSFAATEVIDEEEEMIFPITDLCEEQNNQNNQDRNNNKSKDSPANKKKQFNYLARKNSDPTPQEAEDVPSSPVKYSSSNPSCIKSKPIGIVPKIVNNIFNKSNKNSDKNRRKSSGGSSTTPDSAGSVGSTSGLEENNEEDCIEKVEEYTNASVATTATSLSSTSASWKSSSKPNSGTGCGSIDSNCSASTNLSSNNGNCKMVSSVFVNKVMAHSSSAPKSSHSHHHHHHHHHNHHHHHHHHRVLNAYSNARCTSPNGTDIECDSRNHHHNHYYTVHGTTSNASPVNYDRLFQKEPTMAQQINQKQRTRSHSGGPIFSNGFTQQIRHSALISAGMAIVKPPQRRQSDTSSLENNDGECSNSSRSHRTSPNGSSFFEAFRPRSTSDGKSYKKSSSMIAALKNNFRNRHSTSIFNSNSGNINNGSNIASNWTKSSSTLTNVKETTNDSSINCGQNSSSPPPSLLITNQPTRNGALSAPISPNSVIDPFSVDYTHAVRAFETLCQNCSAPLSPIVQLQSTNRPRSRSGSASTMARVFDMFRGRSNSIATEQPQNHCHHCHHKPTFNHQDSLCDRFEFEDIDENLVYVRFFKFYRCYDIIPTSAKLVVFDTQLAVKKAFYALLINGIRAAPLWDSQKHQFIGMLTITDFIYILRTFYQSTESKMEKLEEHTLDNWRSILKDKARPLVFVEPDESLFNAIKMLLHNKVHRLPVIDRDSGNVLYIMTHKRILKFLFLFYYTRLPMPSYLQKTLRELPKIGTYENIATATADTPLMDALTTLTERRISALPIVDKKNKVVDVYAKFDVIHLASDKMYQNLDITIKKALEFRNQSEHVVKCTMNETLHTIMERIVQAEVHRIIVVDQEDHVIGIISLSDLLNFLVLRPVNNQVNETGSVDYPSVVDVANSLKSSSLRSDSDLLMTQTATTLVEESGEDVSSQCSHTENDNSRTTMGNLEDDAKIEECEEIALAQEQITENCQLSSLNSSRCSNNRRCSESSSSSTTTTSSSSTSSITNDDNNNDDTTNRPTKSTMAIKASSAATQPTLIA